MTSGARRLLTLLVLVGTCLALVRLRHPQSARLGADLRVAECAIPVEREGEGVLCLGVEVAARAGLSAGDRRRPDGGLTRMAPERLAALEVVLDPNRASATELASLPGIGPKLAEAIVAHRPFRRTEDLAAVPGLGPRRLRAIAPRLALRSPR